MFLSLNIFQIKKTSYRKITIRLQMKEIVELYIKKSCIIKVHNLLCIKTKKFNSNYQKNSTKIKKTKVDFKVVELNLKKQKAPK